MNSTFLLQWARDGISLFNTILLFWLSGTVLLNAQKRTGGIWIAVIGLLAGGVFFATHTVMLNASIVELLVKVRWWWYFFFVPIVILPYAWYLLMLWYAGFWDDGASALHRRHRWGLMLSSVLMLVLFVLLMNANPFVYQNASGMVQDLVERGGRISPLYTTLYPVAILLCLVLAMHALLRPVPSSHMMGDLARRRARPWLLAASLAQLVVSLIVGAALAWLTVMLRQYPIGYIAQMGAPFAALFDLVIISLIALTVILMGKAIVSFEIFTGRTLPRRGDICITHFWCYCLVRGHGNASHLFLAISCGGDEFFVYIIKLATL